ncbi:hypothetical protein QN277_007342 [Acacia crassicarpa]|uniref:Transmembrane protein n=1 Tax=Acacia crassicarpa TaxID=499986 RepID=A0AAE1IX61_9FABA|nr:hypothetical protein QN277_007342 [Acacia crassicarpa]
MNPNRLTRTSNVVMLRSASGDNRESASPEKEGGMHLNRHECGGRTMSQKYKISVAKIDFHYFPYVNMLAFLYFFTSVTTYLQN